MKKQQENADRVDQDAYEREQERQRREREAIAEMAGEDGEAPEGASSEKPE